MKQPKNSSIIRPAWNIYRTYFKIYYSLALIGSFWMIIPIYGWAKYTSMMGLLTRLAYGELTGNTESVAEAKRNIKPKMWSFLNLGWKANWHLWIKLLFLALKILAVFIVILCILSLISIVYSTFSLQFIDIALLPLSIGSIVSIVYYYLLVSRLHLYELPLAVETNINARRSMGFSAQLVKKENYSFSILIIISIFTVVFTISMFGAGVLINPLAEKIDYLIADYPFSIANFLGSIFLICLWFINMIHMCSTLLALVFIPFPTIMFLLMPLIVSWEINLFFVLYPFIAALFIPLWQSIKAVIYYRLKLGNEYRNLLPDRST